MNLGHGLDDQFQLKPFNFLIELELETQHTAASRSLGNGLDLRRLLN